MSQLNWLDQPARARSTDPDTSKTAAGHNFKGQKLLVLNLVTNHPDSTPAELAHHYWPKYVGPYESEFQLAEALRKRFKELVEAGAIQVSGERTCRISGTEKQTYRRR